ncbi:ATP-binding protein [Maricaulaceae bacterium NA33B04]|nr:ATP-binding protein [Maricaulaceae bacterium NA33B04]
MTSARSDNQPNPGFGEAESGAARAALDAMAELVLMRDAQGRIIEVNTAFLNAFGGTRTDWIGCWFAVAPASSDDGAAQRYDVAMKTRDGPLWIEWSETITGDGSSVSVGRDVSAEREAREQQSEAARGKSVFFAAVTHELRTPLSGALGAADLLADTGLAADQNAYLKAVRDSAAHALGLIDDILDLTRLEAGRLDLRPGPVDVRQLIEDACEVLAPRAADRGLTLSHAIAADVPGLVEADEARLKQIVFNLAGNAMKFTETGGVLITVEMSRDQLQLSVRDSGPGISQEDQRRLFEHFERGAAERKAAPGAGLGLAMVKRLAEAMGGTVGVKSSLGAGAVFWVTAPLAALEPAPRQRELASRTLLVATPEKLQRKGICRQAEALGATVHWADSLEQALSVADGLPDTLTIILDESWASHAPDLKARASAAHILALAEPRTKDLFSGAERPDSVDGWLVAPVRTASLANWAAASKTRTREEAGQAGPTGKPLEGLRLILAEDDPVNAMIAKTVLAKLGADVHHVATGTAAVELAKKGGFDAALLDLRMPEMGGIEAAKCIRRDPRITSLPLIALTANATEADRNACLDAGMDAFMTKPLDPTALTDRLTALCAPQNRARVG